MISKILIVEDDVIVANHLRRVLERAEYHVTGIARSYQKAVEHLTKEKPTLVLLDIYLLGELTGVDLSEVLRDQNIPFIYLSANSNEAVLLSAKKTYPYGFLVKPFREKDLLIAIDIARYRFEHTLEMALKNDSLIETQINRVTLDPAPWEAKLLKLFKTFQPYIPYDLAVAGFGSWAGSPNPDCGFLRVGFDEYQTLGSEEMINVTKTSRSDFEKIAVPAVYPEKSGAFDYEELGSLEINYRLIKLLTNKFSIKSLLTFNVEVSGETTFHFLFFSRRDGSYSIDHLNMLARFRLLLANVIPALMKCEQANDPVIHSRYNEELASSYNSAFDKIIGSSHYLLSLFDMITQVSPLTTSVLILGESGTGKERFADCIHRLSSRKDKPFVKVNCATLPSTLIESELFGHEKGAFTGATEKRAGKFELANGGTLFLDEIGEMPVELQAKILRVLQEKEIDRLGSTAPIKIDVRVIAATNRNLEREISEGRFRLDLYYRLNVFPISIPPLRDRIEDIPLLLTHFLQKFSQSTDQTNVPKVSDRALQQLLNYDWPGNVRELENVIERSVILTKDDIITAFHIPAIKEKYMLQESRLKTMEENERDHILTVLKNCHGKIWGTGGAAEILRIPPSTLKSRMKKLGISKNFYEE